MPAEQLSRQTWWSPFSPQDLLKHTPEDHPDHPLLLDAQRNIKQVAERINKGVRSAEEAERHARVLQEIEAHIEGMEDVRAAPPRPAYACVPLQSPGIVALPCLPASPPSLFHICLRPCVLWPDGIRRVDGFLLPLAWPIEGGLQGLGGMRIKNQPAKHLVPPAPQLQAPMRRFLRQEMVIEVVRSVLVSLCLSPPPPPPCSCPCSYPLPTALPALPPQQEPWVESQLYLCLWAAVGESHSSLGLAVPLGTVGRRVGLWA